jgi:hypothetical protein
MASGLVPVIVLCVVLAFVFKNPAQAGHDAGLIWAWFGKLGDAVDQFVQALSK